MPNISNKMDGRAPICCDFVKIRGDDVFYVLLLTFYNFIGWSCNKNQRCSDCFAVYARCCWNEFIIDCKRRLVCYIENYYEMIVKREKVCGHCTIKLWRTSPPLIFVRSVELLYLFYIVLCETVSIHWLKRICIM